MNTRNGCIAIDNNTSKCISDNKCFIYIQVRIKVTYSHHNSSRSNRIIVVAYTTSKCLVRIIWCTIAVYIVTKFSVNIYNLAITCSRKQCNRRCTTFRKKRTVLIIFINQTTN